MSTVVVEINRKPFQNFVQVSVTRSMETIASTMSATATIDLASDFPIRIGDHVRVLINDIPVMHGYIEILIVDYAKNKRNIRVQGRDKAGDIVDSGIIGNIDLKPPITLAQTISTIIRSQFARNLSIDVIDNVRPRIFGQGDIISAEVGANMFDLINKYCMKRQSFITNDGDGNVVITRASTDVLPAKLYHSKTNTEQNNVLTASVTYDHTDRFGRYTVQTQGNPVAFNLAGGETEATTIAKQPATVIRDSKVRGSRIFVITGDDSNTGQTATERAQWEQSIRKARSMTYSVTVFDFFNAPGIIWEPNKLVVVDDFSADIDNSQLLIKSVTYDFSDSGSTTEIEMTFRDAFTLQLAQDSIVAKADNRSNATANNFELSEADDEPHQEN